jgi:hypothetical protein
VNLLQRSTNYSDVWIKTGPAITARPKIFDKDCAPADLLHPQTDTADLNMKLIALKVQSADSDSDPDPGPRLAGCQL